MGNTEITEPIKDTLLRITADGELVAKLTKDGGIELGDGYTPTDAAREFWRHMGQFARQDADNVAALVSAAKGTCERWPGTADYDALADLRTAVRPFTEEAR